MYWARRIEDTASISAEPVRWEVTRLNRRTNPRMGKRASKGDIVTRSCDFVCIRWLRCAGQFSLSFGLCQFWGDGMGQGIQGLRYCGIKGLMGEGVVRMAWGDGMEHGEE